MSRKKSEEYFHVLPENLNCAQAVLKGFQQELNITDEVIEEYRAWGGGRAEGGVCGALFSAEHLLRQAGKPSIETEFVATTGHMNCLDIKQGKFPCLDCVRIADELVERNL
jgi:hypothetical protein